MTDKIFMSNGTIVNWIPESMTGDEESIQKSMEVMNDLIEEHGPVTVLVDLSKAHRPNSKQREIIISALQADSHKILKIALFGETPLMKAVAYYVINTSGFSNMRFFANRSKAEQWLKESDSS